MGIVRQAFNESEVSNLPYFGNPWDEDDYIITSYGSDQYVFEIQWNGEVISPFVVSGEFVWDGIPTNFVDALDVVVSHNPVNMKMYSADYSALLEEWSVSNTVIPVELFFSHGQPTAITSIAYSGNDGFYGSPTATQVDSVLGFGGNDTFIGYSQGEWGGDWFNGGDGVDVSVYSQPKAHYEILVSDQVYDALSEADNKNTATGLIVSDVVGSEGLDNLIDVERLEFSDVSLALDLDGSAGQTVKTLAAVIGEDGLANREYVGIGLQLFDAGQSLAAVCELALTAVGATSNEDVVNLLYANLYGEAPTADVAQPFVDALNNGEYSKGILAAAAAELTDDLGVIDLVGLAETGIEYV